ncbi:phosphatase PAP2 family protein [Vreelandella aquamarina]
MKILVLSWLTFLVTMIFFSVFHIDFMVADWLYQAQGNAWLLKDSFIAQAVIHQGGKNLSVFLGLLTLIILITSFFWQRLSAWRWPLLYLFLATLLSTLTVSIIKQLISMECPWDLTRYGGPVGFISLLEARPPYLPDSACFPSGHASAGYAWISLYYFFLLTRPSLRWLGLGIAILLGLTFGITQQLRGAHFLSHDLWTIMICWTISFMLSRALSLSINQPL